MIYIGVIAVSLAVLFVLREYVSYISRRLRECEGFLLFCEHMHIELGCFLRAPDELYKGFASAPLSEAGFIPLLEEGENLYTAYMKCESRLAISEREKEILSVLFSSLGKGYLDDSIKMIDAAEKQLSASLERLKEECPKQKKLAASLSACAVLGFIILVI